MNLEDLRYSNSLYIYRTVINKEKTVEEIAKETEMTPLTVNKIVKKLVADNVLARYIPKVNKRCGRPNIYYGPSPYYFSALLLSDNGTLFVYYIFPDGATKLHKGVTTKLIQGGESIIANVMRGHIGKDNPLCLGIFLAGDDMEKFNDIKFITKLDTNDLLIKALSDSEKTIFVEYDNERILINHSKPRIINMSKEELIKILDIDEIYNLTGKRQSDIIIFGMIKLTQKLLESKI